MVLSQETIDQQQTLLGQQRQRLALLFEQQAKLGLHTPPYVIIDMREAQAAIASIKIALRAGGSAVEDAPNDATPLAAITPQSALHRLRAPVGDFVGRADEIAQLVQALSTAAQTGAAAAISGVRGMGGIGKTELAYRVAQRLQASFPDAQLLVELRGASATPLAPEQALQTVIRVFAPEAKLPDDLSQLVGIYASVLAGKRVLILADDARDAAQVRPLLPPAGCALLVTSRQRFTLPAMRALDLGTLPPDEAAQLLREICPRIGAHAAELARLCGALPLALRVSAAVLEANDTRSVPRYLAQLSAERLKHLSDPDDPAASVEASLQLSYAALPADAQAALCQLSVFPASFDPAAALVVVDVERDATAMLELLRRRSLLEWDAALEHYGLHDLVRAFGAARLADGDDVRLRHARHYYSVASRTGELYDQGGAPMLAGLALFDRERAQIDAGWAWAIAHAEDQIASQLIYGYADAVAYIVELRYDARRERIPYLKAALAAARRFGNRRGEGNILNNLGLAYADLGQARQAIDFYEQRLVIAREIGDRRGEGSALSNMGIAYKNLGNARQAVVCYEQALAVWREMGDRRGEATTLGNLGTAYRILGKTSEVIAFYEQWLVIAREIGDRRGEGQALGNLGQAYFMLDQARQAITFYEQALVIAREIGDRRSEGAALGNMGIAYAELGDARQAITFYEQALVIAREMGDRRGEGAALGSLGLAYADLGDTQQAIGFYEQALVIARATGDQRGAATHSWNLGFALDGQGDPARAAELMQVYVDYLRELGHPDAETRAAEVEEVRARGAGGEGAGTAGEG